MSAAVLSGGEAAALVPNPARERVVLVGDSLGETFTTPAQRGPLYEVAARVPGVELVAPVCRATYLETAVGDEIRTRPDGSVVARPSDATGTKP